jgi:hypothetical protein
MTCWKIARKCNTSGTGILATRVEDFKNYF